MKRRSLVRLCRKELTLSEERSALDALVSGRDLVPLPDEKNFVSLGTSH